MIEMDNNFIFLENVAYGNHERHSLDIYIPNTVKSHSGVILFIHGGGWHQGYKEAHRPDAEFCCNEGYVSATMNYRFVSESLSVYDELDDISSALEVIKEKCSEYGLKVNKLILSGASAGAHLSLLYAYTRKETAPLSPVAVCAYCPPVDCSKTDFLIGISGQFESWKYEILSKCCGIKITKDTFLNEPQQQALKRISPQNYVDEFTVPTAVFHGKLDDIIPLEHIREFVDLLKENGVKNDLLIYENSGHTLDKDPEAAEKARENIRDYAVKYF